MHYSPACVQPPQPPPPEMSNFLNIYIVQLYREYASLRPPRPGKLKYPPLPEKKLLDLRMALINVQLVGHFSVLNNFCEALRILVTCGFFFENSLQGK